VYSLLPPAATRAPTSYPAHNKSPVSSTSHLPASSFANFCVLTYTFLNILRSQHSLADTSLENIRHDREGRLVPRLP